MGMHEDVGDAKGFQGNPWPIPGLYPLIQIEQLIEKQDRHGNDLYIAEIAVLKSEVAERPPGSRMSVVISFKHDAAADNVKGLLAAILDCEVGEIDADTSMASVSQDQPGAGRLVRLEASTIQTKAKTDFTKLYWKSIDDEMQAKAAELRAAAGFEPL